MVNVLNKKKNKRGFTLVELIVVIAIVAILATVSVVGYTQYIKKAEDAAIAAEFKSLQDGARAYAINGDEENNGVVDVDSPTVSSIKYNGETDRFEVTKEGAGTVVKEDIAEALVEFFKAINENDSVVEKEDFNVTVNESEEATAVYRGSSIHSFSIVIE